MTPGRAEEYERVAQQVAKERVAAKLIVDDLRSIADAEWNKPVPPAWHTLGFVEELTSAAYEMLKEQPRTTIALCRLAISIGTTLSPESYPQTMLAQAIGVAWKELANGHRYVSEYEAAMGALDWADQFLARSPSLGYDRAVARLARALLLSDIDRGDEALPLLDECIFDFTEFTDRRRAAQCLQLKGIIQHRRSQYRDAARSYQDALDQLGDSDDYETRAGLLNNMGQAYGHLGNTDAAVRALSDAIALFCRIKASGEVARTVWGLGIVLVAAGRYGSAREALVDSRRDLRLLGFPEEAGLAGLDLADVLLATGAEQEAEIIVAQVIEEFRAANLNQRALMALSYLPDVLPTPRARAAVKHVRTYIDELRHSPNLLFLPLSAE